MPHKDLPKHAKRSTATAAAVSTPFCILMRRFNRRLSRRQITFVGGPLGGLTASLDRTGGLYTLPLAAMKGFPPGRYEGSTWKPET